MRSQIQADRGDTSFNAPTLFDHDNIPSLIRSQNNADRGDTSSHAPTLIIGKYVSMKSQIETDR